MAYHALPDSPQYYVEYDVSWPGVVLYVLGFSFGFMLACFVGAALSALIHPDLDTPQPDIGAEFTLLSFVAMLGISRLIKYFILSRMGGHVRLGFTTRSLYSTRSAQTWRYMDAYAPDIYLTRAEYVRVTVTPHVASLAIMATLLAFGSPLLQFAAILGLAAKTLDILLPLLNLAVALRCPANTLFVESSSGVLDVYKSAAPTGS